MAEPADGRQTRRPRKIVGPEGAEYFLLNAGEICAFHAEERIVWIATLRRKYIASQTPQ